jgi:hypothetical protein
MHLGTASTALIGRYDGCSVGELLTELGATVRGKRQLEVREWVAIVAWADQNVVDTLEGAATVLAGVVDTGVPIAGPGAPLVSEFALMELIAVLGRSPDGGRMHVGGVIECAWRLPHVYAAVVAGRIPPHKAHRIADATRSLCPEAAAFVDRQLGSISNVSWKQLQRLVAEAILRFDPERAEAERQKAEERRFCEVSDVDEHGNTLITAVVDATAQIKAWLRSRETTSIVVRPVTDLADCIPVDSYEIPDRHRDRVQLRDHTCRFPNCPVPATRCDLDHRTPHNQGGPTCPCNLTPLCRRHHRAKPFSRWRYRTLAPSHYLWTSPHGRLFHVGPGGTQMLDPPRPADP